MSPKILRIDMKNLTSKWEDLQEKHATLAGRAFTSTIISEEVDPMCHPLGAQNKFVVSPGLLAGTVAPSSGRLSVGGKSPLTDGIKEANAGGLTATKLGRLGIRGVIIENQPDPATENWYSIIISKDKCEIKETNQYAGRGLYELIDQIWKDYPTKPGIIGCGIAGQRLSPGAGVFGNNIENTDPGRYAGRGGLGAVLGSKRIVSIITDDSAGSKPEMKDEKRFKNGAKALTVALNAHPVTGKLKDEDGNTYGGLKNYGTNVLMNVINESGGLPTKNFTSGRFEHAAKISGEAVHELVDQTKEKFGEAAEGKYGHPCHPGCVMACSNVVPYADTGKAHVAPLEYESAWSLGANCGISELHDVAELNRICNDCGLDTIEAGNTIAMFMEGGIIDLGDGKAAIELMKEIYDKKSVTGRLLSSGALVTGRALGVSRIPVVKGQSLPAYDPRAIRGIGVTYSTSTMGADHTAGYTIAAEILGVKGEVADPRDVKKSDLSRNFQATTAYIDSMGYCVFIAFCILDDDSGMAGMVDTVNGFLGQEIDIGKYGSEVLAKECAFNRAAGFTKEDDRLPEFFYKEPLPPHNVTFDVEDEELDSVLKGICPNNPNK